MLFLSVFVMLSCLFIAAFCSYAGKGLTSWLSFVVLNCVFTTFPCGILGQVWYLIFHFKFRNIVFIILTHAKMPL